MTTSATRDDSIGAKEAAFKKYQMIGWDPSSQLGLGLITLGLIFFGCFLGNVIQFKSMYCGSVLLFLLLQRKKHMQCLELVTKLSKSTTMTEQMNTKNSENRKERWQNELEWAAVTGRGGREGTVAKFYGFHIQRVHPSLVPYGFIALYFALSWATMFDIFCRQAIALALILFLIFNFQGSPGWSYTEHGFSGHQTYPIITALSILIFDHQNDFGRFCIQLAHSSAYLGAGLSKLASGYKYHRPWDGNTLAFYILNAIPNRPMVRFSLRYYINQVFLSTPSLLHFLAYATVIVEVGAALAPFFAPRIAGLILLSFHLGLGFVMHIHFLEGWGPSLLALLLGPIHFGSGGLWQFISEASSLQLCALLLATISVLASISLFDLPEDSSEFPPLSCYPVFAHPCRLLDDAQVLVLHSLHEPGPPIDPYYVQSVAASSPNAGHWNLRNLVEISPSTLLVATEIGPQFGQLEIVSNIQITDDVRSAIRRYFTSLRIKRLPPHDLIDLVLDCQDQVCSCSRSHQVSVEHFNALSVSDNN